MFGAFAFDAGNAAADAIDRAATVVADAPRRVLALSTATPAQRSAIVAHAGTTDPSSWATRLGWSTLVARDGAVTYVTPNGLRVTRGAALGLAAVAAFLFLRRRRR